MDRKGLELLKQVDKYDDYYFELINNIVMPPVFLNFITNYKIGYNSFSLEKLLLNDIDMYPLSAILMYDGVEMNGEEYFGSIDYIFPYKRLIEEIGKYERMEENWNKLGFIQIGLLFHGDVLLLGVEKSNTDEIWRYGQGLIYSVHSKLEDNIIEFFKKAKEVLLEEDIKDWGISINDLYKNWNEDFWRVKETQDPEKES